MTLATSEPSKVDHWSEDVRKCSLFIQSTPDTKVAIFDIGTRSVKLLVAPATTPSIFSEHTFWTVGYPFNLGQAVNTSRQRLNLSDWRTKQVLSFLKLHTDNLRKHGVTEIHIIATAVLRWSSSNIDEVLEVFKQETGVTVQVLSQETEGILSLLLLPEIVTRRKKDVSFNDDDYIVLIDQGGGSLELGAVKVSDWKLWSEHGTIPAIEQLRYPSLGTTSLAGKFYELTPDLEHTDPQNNATPVAHQMAILTRWIDKEIDKNWSTIESPIKGKTVHVFGLGTAITEIVSGNSYRKHGKVISKELIERTLGSIFDDFTDSSATVSSLFQLQSKKSGRHSSKGATAKDLDRNLAIMHGLPVFYNILRRFNLDYITINGYGLRFAYYLWVTLYNKQPLGTSD